jgi:Flp pilus assembly protein TadG
VSTFWGSRKSQRGAAALEFAIVVPVLILLVFGIIDFGGVMNAQVVVANAAREGARSAALGGSTTTATATVRTVMGSLPGASDTTITQVTVVCTSLTNVVDSTCTSTTDAGGKAVATITYKYTWLSPVPLGLASTINVTQSSQMRIE